MTNSPPGHENTVSHSPAAARADVAAVHSVLARVQLHEMIDIHTHFMPHNVLSKVWRYFDSAQSRGEPAWPIAYRLDETARVQRLREYGVKSFSALLYAHKPGMAQWLNAWSSEFADRTPECLRTATFYPEQSAGQYVRAAIDGRVQIFKCHVRVGNFDVNDKLLAPVWSQIQDAHIPVVIHAGSGPKSGRFTGPEPVAALMRRYPRLPLIIAHMGMPEYTQFMHLAANYEFVRLDTTMVFTDFIEQSAPFPAGLRAQLVDLQPKILFGSDYPNIPYPYAHALRSVVGLGLGSRWTRAVLYENALALFARRPTL